MNDHADMGRSDIEAERREELARSLRERFGDRKPTLQELSEVFNEFNIDVSNDPKFQELVEREEEAAIVGEELDLNQALQEMEQ